MPGGRPSEGKQQQYQELEELAVWFRESLHAAGHDSVHAFVQAGLFEKNAVYAVLSARKLLTLESTQALAAALRRDPAEVKPVWLRAKEARDRAVLAESKENQRRLTSWEDLPLPSLALRNLLEAQSVASEQLPYSSLGVGEPALSTIYIKQQIQARGAEERAGSELSGDTGPAARGDALMNARSGTAGEQPTLSVWDALERHDHLLITGEPGAGKSTLGSHLIRSLSLVWLRQTSSADVALSVPVVPVRVAARLLDGEGSWSEVLARAATRTLGQSLLQEPDAGLFARPAQGARWLVVVDGLDEIPDSQVRADVIRSVAQHSRIHGDYRFVVTTRALAEAEFGPLKRADVGRYAIEPFDEPDLREFARRWFEAQPADLVANPEEAAERFLREVSDGRLRDLVRNPLLATITAVTAVKEPGKPLPTSRVQLYAGFCDYLLSSRHSRREPIPQLRRRHQDDPDRLGCVVWLHRRQADLVAAAARGRLESEGSVWQTAVTWVKDNVPEDVSLVDGWQSHLREELIGTGLLITQENDLRFLHQSFAEFLAARKYADTIDDEFTELDVWVRRSFQESQRTLVLFTLTLWSAEPSHDIAAVFDRLLATRDPRKLELTGRLMAEGVTVSHETAAVVIRRLLALARNATEKEAACNVIDLLGTLFEYPAAIRGLEGIALCAELDISRQTAAVLAYGRVKGGAQARELLLEFLPSVSAGKLESLVPLARQLGDAATDATRVRAAAILTDAHCHADERADVAEVSAELALVPQTEHVAREVLADRHARSPSLKKAMSAWYRVAGTSALTAMTELALGRPESDLEGRATLAQFLASVGETQVACRLAEGVLTDARATVSDIWSLMNAAEALLSAQGAAAVSLILSAVDRSAHEPTWQAGYVIPSILRKIAETDPNTDVVPRLYSRLRDWPGSSGRANLIQAWLAVQGISAIESIMECIDQGNKLSCDDQALTATKFQSAGADQAAVKLAGMAFKSPAADRFAVHHAARVLLELQATTTRDLMMLAENEPPPSVDWLAGIVRLADEDMSPETEELVVYCARRLMERATDGNELEDAMTVLICLDPGCDLTRMAETGASDPRLSVGEKRAIALVLAGVDELEHAKAVWTRLMTHAESSWEDQVKLTKELLIADVGLWAVDELKKLVDAPETPPRRRTRLRQLIASIELSEQAATSATAV